MRIQSSEMNVCVLSSRTPLYTYTHIHTDIIPRLKRIVFESIAAATNLTRKSDIALALLDAYTNISECCILQSLLPEVFSANALHGNLGGGLHGNLSGGCMVTSVMVAW